MHAYLLLSSPVFDGGGFSRAPIFSVVSRPLNTPRSLARGNFFYGEIAYPRTNRLKRKTVAKVYL